MKYDYLVVGAGLFGATFAQQAKEAGKTAPSISSIRIWQIGRQR